MEGLWVGLVALAFGRRKLTTHLAQRIAKAPNFRQIVVLRGRDEKELTVKLKAEAGHDALLAEAKSQLLEQLGVELEPLPADIQKKYGLSGGVLVSKVKRGTSAHSAGLREGFVIISIDRQPVTSVADVVHAITNRQGGALVACIYPGRPGVFYFAIGLDS